MAVHTYEMALARIEELEAKADHAWNMVAKCDADVIAAVARADRTEAMLKEAVGWLHTLSTLANGEYQYGVQQFLARISAQEGKE